MNQDIIKLLKRRISKRVLRIPVSKQEILKSLLKVSEERDSRIYLPQGLVNLRNPKKSFGVWYDTRNSCFRYLGLSEEAAERALHLFFKLGAV